MLSITISVSPGAHALAFVDMNGNDHTRHRRFGNIVRAAAGMAPVAQHRIDIADRMKVAPSM